MRQLIAVFFLLISFLNLSSASPVHEVDTTRNQVVQQTTPAPLLTSTPETAVPIRSGPPLSLTLLLLGMCCVFAVFIGVVVLGFVARHPKNEEENNSK